MTQTWLVTGGAGFIGGNFVLRQVLENNVRVINLDKLTYAGNLDTLKQLENNDNHIFIQGDITDNDLVAEIFDKYKPNAVVNFAAESHVDRSIDAPDDFIQTNILGTFNLVKNSLNYYQTLDSDNNFRFLHVSTDEVYGSLGETGLFTETTPYSPNSPYSASKASSDHLVRAYFHTYGLPVLTTNCSNNYGPYQFPEKLIPLIITKALNFESLPVYGDGKNIRDW
ncbi:MAG TPA: SDR family NAD(P)-dependent oxidoreductase, partial [Gammaproteobacteria bacterium]|nr:SDR family NAD(P)-dependent oxidoreductase [Gammaproteobacteria bacterium]